MNKIGDSDIKTTDKVVINRCYDQKKGLDALRMSINGVKINNIKGFKYEELVDSVPTLKIELVNPDIDIMLSGEINVENDKQED